MIFIRRMLVLGWRPGRLVLYWYPVCADERQRQINKSAPCRAIRRSLMRARRCELKPRAGRRTVWGARRGAYPKTPRQNTGNSRGDWWVVIYTACKSLAKWWGMFLGTSHFDLEGWQKNPPVGFFRERIPPWNYK